MDPQQNKEPNQNKSKAPKIVNLSMNKKFDLNQALNQENQIPIHQGNEPLYQPEIQLTEMVKFTLQTDLNNYSSSGTLQIDDSRYWLIFSKEDNQSEATMGEESAQPNYINLSIDFCNTQNLGTSGSTLIIFLNSNPKGEIVQPQTENQAQKQPNEADEILQLIKANKGANLFLQGEREEDQGADEDEQDQELGEMIYAHNIDQNGNVISNKKESSDEGDSEDLDEEPAAQPMEDQSKPHN